MQHVFFAETATWLYAEHTEIPSWVKYPYLALAVLKFNVHPFITLKSDLYMPENLKDSKYAKFCAL